MRLPNPAHVSRIVRTEARRRLRSLAESGLRVLLLVFGFGLVALMQVAVGVGIYLFAGDVTASVLPLARVGAGGAWVVVVAITAFGVLAQRSSYDAMDGLLTTVPAREVTLAMLCTEAGGALLPFAPLLVVAPLAFGLATGSALAGAAAFLALACLVVSAALVGFALGFGVKNLAVRSAFVARYRTLIAALAVLTYFLLLTTEVGGDLAGTVARAVAATPIAWLADLALLPVVPASAPAALGALCLLTVLAVGAVLAAFPLTEALWYADRATPAERDTVATETSLAPGPFARLDAGPAGWVAYKSVVRARRAPVKLLYVAYPLFALGGPVGEAFATGLVPAVLVVYVAVYVAWAAGAGFALNPLGDEGALLPVSATSGISGRAFARGHLLATAAVGAPVALLGTAVVGVISPLSPVRVAVLAVVAAGLCVGAGGLAAGVGSALPRYEAVRVTRSRRATVPSLLAFVVYSLLLLVAALPVMLAGVPGTSALVGGLLGVSGTGLLLPGAALSLGSVGVLGFLGYRHAAARFGGYAV